MVLPPRTPNPWSARLALFCALSLIPLACGEVGPVSGLSTAAVTGDSPTARLEAAVARSRKVKLSFEGIDQLGRYKGDLFVDRPEGFTDLPADRTVVDALRDPELRALLDGDDEGKAADLLRSRGSRLLLLHADATPGVDRGRSVLQRLYHHDHLEHFKLMRRGDGALYYKLAEAPVQFPPQLADLCIRYLRARLAGQPPSALPAVDPGDGTWTFAGTIRGQGVELAAAFSQDDKLEKALDELADDLEKVHRRRVEMLGFPPLRLHMDDLTIDLHRVTERTAVEPRDEATLDRHFEMGIDGAFLLSADRKERAVLPGAASFTRSLRTADQFLRTAAELGAMSDRRPWRAPDSSLETWRGVHYRETGIAGISLLYRGVPAIPMSQVTVEAVRRGVVAAGDWYMHNLGPNGEIVYKFWPSENRYANEYNHVRHTLGTWNLVTAWRLDNSRADFLEGARRALAFSDRFLVKERDPNTGLQMAYYSFDDVQKLGSVVVNMLGIIDLAKATGDKQWDEQLREMGRFVLFMQEKDGRFRPYHVPAGHAYDGKENDIVPGEAALALIELANYFDDDAWIATLPSYWTYYEPWWRSRAERRHPDRPWPADTYANEDRLDLVEIGPWTVMAANAYHKRTGDEKSAAFALDIARWMIENYEWTETTAPFPDYQGGYYKLPGELPAMQAFCYAEGTAAAYQLALRFRPAEAAYFELHTRETMRFALQMQYDDLSTYAFSRPDQVNGGVRYAMNETKVRVDYVHHALSAMAQWVEGARSDPSLAAEVRDGPATPGQRLLEARDAAYAKAVEAGDMPSMEALEPVRGRAVSVPVPLRRNDALRFQGKPAPHPMEGKTPGAGGSPAREDEDPE